MVRSALLTLAAAASLALAGPAWLVWMAATSLQLLRPAEA